MSDAIDLANDVLSQALADKVFEQIKSGKWAVVSIAGRGALPAETRQWCREDMGVEDPILVVLEVVKVVEPVRCR